jgi:F-type H+-transporting ATPase subunit gamma
VPSLKSIRKRIASVKSTQKITRAMKMVAGARLNRAQQRITELRPYAIKTRQVLVEVTAAGRKALAVADVHFAAGADAGAGVGEPAAPPPEGAAPVVDERPRHPLLEEAPERHVLLVILTSDRGLCGSFNASICKLGEHEWRRRTSEGQKVTLYVIGRKGRDYFRRRNAPMEYVEGVWDNLGWDGARKLGRKILKPFLQREDTVDAIYFVYNEFKSAISQKVVAERLLPIADPGALQSAEPTAEGEASAIEFEFEFEPDENGLLEQLVPMYVQVSILRALLESMASELGARMTAMDAATSNAADMIGRLTLQYNRARQAAITKELMEIIGGSEALKG